MSDATNNNYSGLVDSTGRYAQPLPGPGQPYPGQQQPYPQQQQGQFQVQPYPQPYPQQQPYAQPYQQQPYPQQNFDPRMQMPQPQQPPQQHQYPEYRFTPPTPEQLQQLQTAIQAPGAPIPGQPMPGYPPQPFQQQTPPLPQQQGFQQPAQQITPQQIQELQELQRLAQTEDWRIAMGLVKTYQQDPKQFVRQYMAKEVDEILAEHKLSGAKDPATYAEEYAEGRLLKEFGKDFDFDPSEALQPGTPSHRYNARRQAFITEGIVTYQQRIAQEHAQRTKEQLDNERAMLARLQAAGVPANYAEQFKQTLDKLTYSPEEYWDMVIQYADSSGLLNALRPSMPYNPQQSYIPQQQPPPPPYPQMYPQQQPIPQAQPQPYMAQQYVAPQYLPREVQPLPLPGVSQLAAGQQRYMSATQQSLANTFPPGFLTEREDF